MKKYYSTLLRSFGLYRFCSQIQTEKIVGKQANLLYQKLNSLNDQYVELQNLAIQFVNYTLLDFKRGNCTETQRKTMNQLEPKISIYQKFRATIYLINDLNNSLQSNDIEEVQFAKEEIEKLKAEALNCLLDPEQYDDCTSTNIEIRPGVGGSEGSLFAEDILNMFQEYASQRNWSCQVLSHQKDSQIGKGCKYGVLHITGSDSYCRLKCESGVHKVIRVPETESKGRLHSSTISVVVLPNVQQEFQLNELELRFEYMRASGAGGQHVNKTDSACRITHIPTGLQVQNQDERSQDKNRSKALRQMKEKLFAIHVQEKQERLATRRKEQIGTSDRSEKIRTYNFPQDRLTDHRTNITLYGMDKMLNGLLLDQFIDTFLEKIHNAKLQDLLEELGAN